MKQLYTEEVWEIFEKKILEGYKIKNYPQLDPFFDFKSRSKKIKDLVSCPSLQKVKSHSFLPFLKVLLKTPRYRYQLNEEVYKLESKIRPICFSSHFDNHLYGFYSFALNEVYQNFIKDHKFDQVVFAYRTDLKGKCNIQFAKETFDLIKARMNKEEVSVIALDIKGYFDNIDHKILKERWCAVINEKTLPSDQYKIFRSLTQYSYVNFNSFLKHFKINLNSLERTHKKAVKNGEATGRPYYSLLDLLPDSLGGYSFKMKMEYLRDKNLIARNSEFDSTVNERILKKRGIPQGSAMSAVLSNIYLSEFDKKLHKKGLSENFQYRRYCDDLLIVCNSKDVNRLIQFISDMISNDYKLTIQPKKTEILDFKKSLKGEIRSFKREYDDEKLIYNSLSNDNKNFKNLQYLGFEFNGSKIYLRSSTLSRYFRKLKARVLKSTKMAYSKNSKGDKIFKQQIFSRYSHFGRRNFLSYAKNSSKEFYYNSKGVKKEGMNSPSIKRQISTHMRILEKVIKEKSVQRANYKKASLVKK